MYNEQQVILAEVRSSVQLKNKLLFQLGAYNGKLAIFLKRHGEKQKYIIPVEDILTPFGY